MLIRCDRLWFIGGFLSRTEEKAKKDADAIRFAAEMIMIRVSLIILTTLLHQTLPSSKRPSKPSYASRSLALSISCRSAHSLTASFPTNTVNGNGGPTTRLSSPFTLPTNILHFSLLRNLHPSKLSPPRSTRNLAPYLSPTLHHSNPLSPLTKTLPSLYKNLSTFNLFSPFEWSPSPSS